MEFACRIVCIALCAAFATACSEDDRAQLATTAAPTSAGSAGAPERTGILEGTIAPGTYTTRSFVPRLRITFGQGWTALFDEDPDEIAFYQSREDPFVVITRVTRVVDPGTGKAEPAPEDLIAWIRDHPRFETSKPIPTTFGNAPATRVDVETVFESGDQPLFDYPTGPLAILAGDRSRLVVAEVHGDQIVGLASTRREEDLDRALEEVEVVFDSITFL